MAKVTLYTRRQCCLCENAKQVLVAARAHAPFEFEEVDIDGDAELRTRYNDEVPVIAIDGKKAFKYRVDLDEFLRKLGARR